MYMSSTLIEAEAEVEVEQNLFTNYELQITIYLNWVWGNSLC